MNGVANISRSLGQAWLTGVWLFLIAYFSVHAFQGDSSLGALKELEAHQVALEAEARDVAARRQVLEAKIEKMGGNTLDPDMLEELVRQKLGFVHEDEVIIFVE